MIMNKALLTIYVFILFISYLLVLFVRTILELVRRIAETVCTYFDEVLDGVEAPYLETRKKLSDSK